MKPNLIHLAGRIFDTPLMIHRQKLDVILQVLGPRLGMDNVIVAMPDDEMQIGDSSEHDVPDNIALIQVIGPLVKRASGSAMSGGPTTYSEIADAFEEAYTSPSISGIMLEIDSPGGEVGGLFDLADMIYQSRGTKPIYGVANDDSFSAAYALGSACDRLFVTQTGGVGSVGIVAAHCDQSQLDSNLGVKFTYVFAGDRKIDLNPHEPISDTAIATLQAEIDRLYDMFCGTVARNRKMSVAAVKATQAGLFFGQNGVNAGFADQVGTFEDALAALVGRLTGRKSLRIGMAAGLPTSKQEALMDTDSTPVPAAETPEQPIIPEAPQATVGPEPEAAPMPMPDKKCSVCGHAFHGTTQCTVGGCTCMGEAAAALEGTPDPEAAAIPAAVLPETLPPPLGAAAATEIIDLCATAGLSAKDAKAFMSRGLTPLQVSMELLEKRAVATDANPIASQVRPETTGGAMTGNIDAIREQAREVAKQKNITAEAALVQLCTANPQIYQQYLASSQQKTKK